MSDLSERAADKTVMQVTRIHDCDTVDDVVSSPAHQGAWFTPHAATMPVVVTSKRRTWPIFALGGLAFVLLVALMVAPLPFGDHLTPRKLPLASLAAGCTPLYVTPADLKEPTTQAEPIARDTVVLAYGISRPQLAATVASGRTVVRYIETTPPIVVRHLKQWARSDATRSLLVLPFGRTQTSPARDIVWTDSRYQQGCAAPTVDQLAQFQAAP